MPRPGRLTAAADFRRTYSEGRRVSSDVVVMHANQTGEPREACLGYSAGSKIGGAVERNRAKRRMREAVRPLRERLTRGVDLILVATSNTPTCGFQELVDSVERGAAKTGALNG